MKRYQKTTRLGVLVAGTAATLAIGMTGPAMAASGNGNASGHGANVSGPYTPVSQASKGAADLKNPPGQVDNTKDRGYECDSNQGVGQGNPAHGHECVTSSVTPPTDTTTPPTDGGGFDSN